jgi:HPt (histidine-containing phosphotransfer) domain-containing protein
LFFTETPELLSAIRESIARGNAKALEQAAHSVKGTVGSFGAHAACEAALRMELVGRSGDLTHAALAYVELEREIASLGRALAIFKGEQAR